ncbi:hypothetical protein ACYCCF_08030 [Streptomyces argenteolus]|uniref:hypothetical protein n=1 Tax=Streptomyces sp. NPDC025273 TaxID=3155251 RepID=UPI00340D73B9
MTACAIENGTAGAAAGATTPQSAPGPAGPDEPAEPEKPRASAGGPGGTAGLTEPAGPGVPTADVPVRAPASGARTGPGAAVTSAGTLGTGWTRVATNAAPVRGTGPARGTGGSGPARGPDGSGATTPSGRSGERHRAAAPLRAGGDERPVPRGGFGGRAPLRAAGRPVCSEAPRRLVPPVLTIAADHSYAARLTTAAGSGPAWFPERWTLDGPEPYAVSLPLDQPEEADSDVLPLSDGRVLIRRRVAGRHAFSLLYPTGPGTGELPLGALECAELVLLPPPPDGMSAYALLPGERSTAVWLVAGGASGPEHVAEVPGHCSGGAWLDREGRLLALDRRLPGGGPVKAVTVDLVRGGEVTPLLQITPDSDDRLLLADADSGLLLIRSDAPGHDRLGWGVLGSCLPVRFPECLRPADVAVTPFAVQPGQVLMPESCAVALRIDGAAGSWVGLWRPAGRRLHQCAAPAGWLAGAGFWTREGVLHLPYEQAGAPCAVALVEAPVDEEHRPATNGTEPSAATVSPGVCRPVPLAQAPLTGRTARGQ